MTIAELMAKRAAAYDTYKALADKEVLTAEETTAYAARMQEVKDLDGQIARARDAQALAAATAQPVAGQERAAIEPAVETSPYLSEAAAAADPGIRTKRGLAIAGAAKMIAFAGGAFQARDASVAIYGENHPVTRLLANRALITSVGSSGGFIIPPDYMNEIIELLRPETVVRSSGPRVIPMPRGTMTLPGQASPATASYSGETSSITASQQSLDQIIASFKKLTALVPVSNDMMRYSDPAVDAIVRDDLVEVLALKEDAAFMLGDGTANSPRGWLSFANGWLTQQTVGDTTGTNGTVGAWSTTANSTAAVNGTAGNPLLGHNGGNFLTSNETFTLATVATELGGAVNKLDTANVRGRNRVWFMNPRSKNYLYNIQNSLGVYVYRDEMNQGKLLGYPFKCSTQIGTNYWDATGSNKDCSFVFLAEMPESMILDSMQLELAVSREGSYVDANGATQSAFQNDQTLIRAIAEHDFQMRHLSGVAVIQFVRWQPQST